MKTNTKKITLILIAILLLVLGSIIYFKISLNKDIQYIIETKKSNFLVSENIRAAIGIKDKLKEVLDLEKSFDVFFIERNNVLGFIENIEKIAEVNKVTLLIDNVSVDETHLNESLPYGVLNMTLTATGSFDSIMNFLDNLEKIPYYLDFKTVRLVTVGGENNLGWSINVVFSSLTN